jgi:hypothetical protein
MLLLGLTTTALGLFAAGALLFIHVPVFVSTLLLRTGIWFVLVLLAHDNSF